jgi:8-oxo-dGTP pyrophosphatase MutT (NUDIX family)
VTDGPVRDEPADLPTRHQRLAFSGRVWDVRVDEVTLPHGETVTRDLVLHHGAVGVIALDEEDRVMLLRQYRHPVGMYLWEPPAGLLDVAAESPLIAAQRELAEEAGLIAERWWVLADWFNSPGGSTEAFRCFLARDLQPLPGGRPPRSGEEFDLPIRWVPLDEAVTAVLGGALHNPVTVTGVLAAAVYRTSGWADLRPADAPWPARTHLGTAERIRPSR